ncbi:hypothetical protein QUA40_21435 [Microcoleus sp. Pol11C3]|uniref:hypothetical protein n=1 Tax=Microcoleus sp. Pol11C3 TaxID=3055390 RepID=UPI002FD6A1E1
MTIIIQLVLGYLGLAVFPVECCINPKILQTSVGDEPGTRPVQGMLVWFQKHSYLRSASHPLNSASAALFLDTLSQIDSVKLPTYNYIKSQETPRKKPSIRLTIISYDLGFIYLLINLIINHG